MFKTIVVLSFCLAMSAVWAQADFKVEELRTLQYKDGIVNSVAFSPDGKMAVTANARGVLTLWAVETGAEIREIKTMPGVIRVKFTPDGQSVVCCNKGDYSKICFYGVKDGEEYLVLTPGANDINFDKEGKRLVSINHNKISVWDLKDGKEILSIKGPGYVCGKLSPDGKLIAASKGKSLFIWNAEDGKEVCEWRKKEMQAMAFSPDGKFIAFSSSKTISLWNIEKKEVERTLEGHKDLIQEIAFSPNGEYLISGADDKTVRVFSIATGRHCVCTGHTNNIISVAFAPDGKTCISGSRDKSAKIWQIKK